MFYTHSEAKIHIPLALGSFGQQSWRWVEISLQIPIYLLSVSVETDEGPFMRNFLFSQIKDVLELISTSKTVVSGVELGLLSPAYMNATNSYQLGKIKEIWENRADNVQLFVMSDGTKLQFPPNKNWINENEMALIIRF